MAQVAVVSSQSVDSLKVKKMKCLNTTAEYTFGCDVTSDNTLLLTNIIDNSLLGIDSEGKHLFTISTAPYSVFDVTCINDTTVAVTSHEGISIIDISSHVVKKQINVGYDCNGVTYKDGTLLVCAGSHGILSVNLTTEKITTIVRCDLEGFSYITTYKDRLYYTDNRTNTVTCCDIKGNTKWTFKGEDDFFSPRGITTDNDGRLYVCDCDLVIVLSNDGQQSQTFISVEVGLSSPCAIHFDKKRNNLLVSNLGRKVFLFHVSSLLAIMFLETLV